MVFQIGVGFICFVLLFLVEFEIPQMVYRRCLQQQPPHQPNNHQVVDSDVVAENLRIESLGNNQIKMYNLVLRHMTKYYGNFLAVNNLSLAVGP